MITFVTSIFLLILGYLIYGSFVEKNFGVDPERKTPCFTKQDGVDYLPMASWRVYLIQFLNIAGTGLSSALSKAFSLVLLHICGLFLDVSSVEQCTISCRV